MAKKAKAKRAVKRVVPKPKQIASIAPAPKPPGKRPQRNNKRKRKPDGRFA